MYCLWVRGSSYMVLMLTGLEAAEIVTQVKNSNKISQTQLNSIPLNDRDCTHFDFLYFLQLTRFRKKRHQRFKKSLS